MEVSGQFYDPAALPPEKAPSTYRKGGCVGPGAGFNDLYNSPCIVSIVKRRYVDGLGV
jgi:hypothetical protein